jgi:hypothetical protein
MPSFVNKQVRYQQTSYRYGHAYFANCACCSCKVSEIRLLPFDRPLLCFISCALVSCYSNIFSFNTAITVDGGVEPARRDGESPSDVRRCGWWSARRGSESEAEAPTLSTEMSSPRWCTPKPRREQVQSHLYKVMFSCEFVCHDLSLSSFPVSSRPLLLDCTCFHHSVP